MQEVSEQACVLSTGFCIKLNDSGYMCNLSVIPCPLELGFHFLISSCHSLEGMSDIVDLFRKYSVSVLVCSSGI